MRITTAHRHVKNRPFPGGLRRIAAPGGLLKNLLCSAAKKLLRLGKERKAAAGAELLNQFCAAVDAQFTVDILHMGLNGALADVEL